MSLVFSERVTAISSDYIMPEIIKSIAGEDAKQWYITWCESPENKELQKTINQAWATNKWKGLKVKSPLDRRTKSGKHIAWLRDKLSKQFEAREGVMPYEISPLFRKVLNE